MCFVASLRFVVPLLAASSFTLAAALSVEEGQNPVCTAIAASISSSSNVYYPGDPLYDKDLNHWAASSTQLAKCAVEPGTAADVGIILGIVGNTRTPFAVKGGGHTSNPGFSSTTGVHISMHRFSAVVYNPDSQTVDIGAGLIWDDVYEALEPYGVNVVGGRVPGVGVAGFTLGGGFSWKTNQYGMTIDTVTAYELVKPDGNVVTVTKDSDPCLFFGLKGGFNNFGIVTKFTLQAFPQTQVWGGLIVFGSDNISDITAATAAFYSKVTDPKAAIIVTYDYINGAPINTANIFYDAPTPPPGIFDALLAIPYFQKDVSTRSFLSLVASLNTSNPADTRVIFNTFSLISLTPSILDAVANETIFWGNKLSSKGGSVISIYAIEPFLPSILAHNRDSTAFPPVRQLGFIPNNIQFSWTGETFDEDFHEAARASAKTLSNIAQSEGQSLQGVPLYPNYAIYGTPLKDIYGSNLPKLQSLQAEVDPHCVMGLAGGWKF